MSEPTPTTNSALGDVPANADLAAAARVFGRLLVKELDAATLTELRAPDIQAALTALGIELPSDEQRAE
ncbi:MAG: hypothetical protein ACJAUC_004513, partial [Planctomycetota bacterium]